MTIRTRADQIEVRFCRFHRANPQVWSWFCYFTKVIRGKQDKGSARAVYERVRWEATVVGTEDPTQFKMNDHYVPYYSRMYTVGHPKAKGFFQLRARASKNKKPYKIEPDTDLGPPGNETDLEDRLIALLLEEE